MVDPHPIGEASARRAARRVAERRRRRRRRGRLRLLTLLSALAALTVALILSTAGPGRPTVREHAPAAQGLAGPGRGPALLAPGSQPSVLPGNVLIADRLNNRLLVVSPRGQIVWSFPRPGDLAGGETFLVPDDAFFTADGRRIVATEEDDYVISIIDVRRRRIVYRYGHPGVPGSAPGYLDNPDDAMLTSNGEIVAADIKNCRLIVIRPPAQRIARQFGAAGDCAHNPPARFSSPNGAFPTAARGLVVTEIQGDWADVLDRAGKLVTASHPPGFTYPSDTNEVRPGVLVSVDYTSPGALETFTPRGRLLWRYAPASGPAPLELPSLAVVLPGGDVLVCDSGNDRVVVIDPRRNTIVWQYGHTGRAGSGPGYLHTPDSATLLP